MKIELEISLHELKEIEKELRVKSILITSEINKPTISDMILYRIYKESNKK